MVAPPNQGHRVCLWDSAPYCSCPIIPPVPDRRFSIRRLYGHVVEKFWVLKAFAIIVQHKLRMEAAQNVAPHLH